MPYVSPRDYRGVVKASRILWPLLKEVEGGLSTGAGVALAALPPLLLRGKPAVYLESIARIEGPSLTGKVLSRLPKIGLYSQHSDWARPPWRLGPSVLSQYRQEPSPPRPIRRVFVTLGTIKPYRFDRLIDTVLAYCRQNPDLDVLWQVGSTSRTDLPGQVVEQLSDADFAAALREHDLIVAHAGVGVAMNILDQGHIPLLMAREHTHDEHVDDHQGEILEHLVGLGLAVRAEEALTDKSLLDHVRATQILRDAP